MSRGAWTLADMPDLTGKRALVTGGPHAPRRADAPHVAYRLLHAGGDMRVASTLDGDVQRVAAQTLRRHLLGVRTARVADGAVLVVDNASGDVLAYVGSSGDLSAASLVDGVRAFEQRLRRAGFAEVRSETMDGWQRGIVHSFLARRPTG